MTVSRLADEIRHPGLRRDEQARRESVQLRVADLVTRFAGSMPFVYAHIALLLVWVLAPVERFPFGFLNVLVSIEAIFLTAFVLISQNRADDRRAAIAEHQWEMIEEGERRTQELVGISRQILSSVKAQQAAQRLDQGRR